MAKLVKYKTLLLTMAIFAIGLGSTFGGGAFADDQDGSYSHQHITASWTNGLVCADHKCTPGELPHNPLPVVPVRGIQ